MNAIVHELKRAGRGITHQPGFSALVIGVLAAGLTCVIYMLIAINSLIVRPLPFPDAQRLQTVGTHEIHDNNDKPEPLRTDDLLQLRRYLTGLADVGGYQAATVNLSDLDRPERFDGAFVTGNLFQVLGAAPALGRDFGLADERDGAPAVVMLSHSLWLSRYSADPAVIGRQIRANAQVATIIGVMPADFSYPDRQDVWIAGHLSAGSTSSNVYQIALRRGAHTTERAVTTAVERWFDDAARAEPIHFRNLAVQIKPLDQLSVPSSTRAVLGVMLVAALLVLLIACANAANVLLAHTLARRQELAIRVALGASRRRLIVHLLAQSLLLSAIACVIALPVARLAAAWTEMSFRTSSNAPPRWIHFTLDTPTIVMTIGVALLTALIAGLLPALRAGGSAMGGDLRDGGRSIGGAFAHISRVLLVGEVAMSLTLLITVGALAGIVAALDSSDLGVDPSGILTARIGLFESAYPKGADQVRLFERITQRLREDPAVIGVTAATSLPGLNGDDREIVADGDVAGDASLPRVNYAAVDDHFLSAYDLKVRRGRFFDSRDAADTAAVAVVDQRFAERYGKNGEVLGRRFRLDPRDPNAVPVTVVGVLPTVWMDQPGSLPRPSIFVPLRQQPQRFVSLAIHVTGAPAAFTQQLTEDIREVAPDTPAYWVRSYAEAIREATFSTRLLAKLFAGFGLLALALAGAGLYGVVAFNVAQRTREIGVRRALGAPPSSVLRGVLARVGWQVGTGLALGLLLGVGLTRALTSAINSPGGAQLFAVIGALAVLIVAALVAVIVPARRALRVDPMVALRHE